MELGRIYGFFNWWRLCPRFYDAGARREAIRTHPVLMAGILRSG